jgi:hypothetical protein
MDLKEKWEKLGYPNPTKFHKYLNDNDNKITLKDVKLFIEKQISTQLHKQQQTKKFDIPFVAPLPNSQWQIDLIDMQKFGTANKGYKWILIAIDIFSRFLYALPVKNKQAIETANAFEQMIKTEKPKLIISDDGGEWLGSFAKLLVSNDILHSKVDVGDHRKLGVVDRMIKTIKGSIYKYFTENDTTTWIDILPTFVESYNNLPHGGIGDLTPIEGKKYIGTITEIQANKIKNVKKSNIKIGDKVRIRLSKTKFERGFAIRFSKTIYTVENKEGNSFVLNDGAKKRAQELQKIIEPDENKMIANEKSELDKAISVDKFKRKNQKEQLDVNKDSGDIIIEDKLIPSRPKREVKQNKWNKIIKNQMDSIKRNM